MRALWAANYSSQSAYAIQSRLFVPALMKAGHNCTVFELGASTSLPQSINGINIVPIGLDPLGADMFQAHSERAQAHAVLTLVDAWGLNSEVMRRVNWFPFVPVDTQPIAPAIVENLKACQRPLAISRYGEGELRRVGLDPIYWPHAVDPTIWHPMDKAAMREKLGIRPEQFFVSFVGVNDSVVSRKGIPELLMAWQIFSAQNPDALLYMHTATHGNLPVSASGGVRIDKLMETFGINPATVKTVDQYRYRTGIPASELAAIAAASDVLVLPTRGEGCGMPLIEFARVGTPAITTNFAGGAEHAYGGWLVEGSPDWNWQNALSIKVDIPALVESLEMARDDRNNPKRRTVAIEGARQHDIENVMSKYALPAMNLIAEHVLNYTAVA